MLANITDLYWPRDPSWSALETAKRRVFNAFLLISGLAVLADIIVWFRFYISDIVLNLPTFAIALAGFGLPLAVRKAPSIRPFAQAFLGIAFIFLSNFLLTEGFVAGSLIAIMLCPVGAILILGPRHGLAFVIATGVVYFSMNPVHRDAGVSFTPEDFGRVTTWGAMTAAAITFFAWIYVREMSRATAELQIERERALAASRSKSEFLANMSHEIRTPMNGVLGMAELIQKTPLDRKQKVFAETIYASGDALLTIINDILDFSKIEAGKLEFDPTPFSLQNAVEDVVTLLGVTARQKGLELMVRLRPGVPEFLLGDVGRIRQILTNIIGNALKFTNEGEVLVDVSCGPVVDGAVAIKIAVSDTGIGIADDKIDLVFEKFTQAEGSTTRKFGGTGLGLSITTGLIEAMGGSIDVRSTLGEGSTFTLHFKLPIHSEQIATGSAQKGVDDVARPVFDRVRILVVDDNATNRAILCENLQAWGAMVLTAHSGSEAIATLKRAREKQEDISLVLLDYLMPEMDGFDVAKEIRANAQLKNTSMIILSSVEGDSVVEAFSAIGVADVVVKPTPAQLLQDVIVKLLTRTHSAMLKATASGDYDAPHAPDTEQTPKAGDVKRIILVADDNPVNRMVVGNMINSDENEIVWGCPRRFTFVCMV
ncbi:MAG: ATP-binding protein [Pseudomonadota bacterium]